MPERIDEAGVEQAQRQQSLARAVRPCAAAVAAALGLAVVGLMVPWSREAGMVRDAFSYSAGLTVLTLLTAAGGAVALAFHAAAPSEARSRAVRVITIPTGVLAMVVGLAVTHHVEAQYRQWWGPGLLEAALLAAMLLTALLDADPDGNPDSARATDPAEVRRGALAALGVAGLVLAAVGLTSTWQRMTGGIVDSLVDAPYVWRGTELTGTLALRWAIAGGLGGCLLVAAIRPLRGFIALPLVAAGATIIALTLGKRLTSRSAAPTPPSASSSAPG
jgi:small-conductance mechanosensitive channel